MPLSPKQKQIKKNKKNAKKKSRASGHAPVRNEFQFAKEFQDIANSPIHECLAQDDIEKEGTGIVIISRKMQDGQIIIGCFLVDLYCLGVQNAFIRIYPDDRYRDFMENNGDNFEILHPSCAKKLIEGSVAFAEQFGFQPHADYKMAKLIFSGIDSTACLKNYVYGQNGKPLYISGPDDDPEKIMGIIEKNKKTAKENKTGSAVKIEDYFKDENVSENNIKHEIIEFYITEDPLHNEALNNVPEEDRNEIINITSSGSQNVIFRIEELIKKYPNIPVLYNYLYNSHARAGNQDKFISVLTECLNKFPNYIFAKISYGNFCIDNKHYDKIPKLFDDKYELSYHIKDRKTFHVSEFASFYGLIARYFKMIGNDKMANNFMEILERVTPNHEITKFTRNIVKPGTIRKWLQKLILNP